jgi:hypothetical protein
MEENRVTLSEFPLLVFLRNLNFSGTWNEEF